MQNLVGWFKSVCPNPAHSDKVWKENIWLQVLVHAIRLLQFLCSGVVFAILVFFIDALVRDKLRIPVTFWVVVTTSGLNIVIYFAFVWRQTRTDSQAVSSVWFALILCGLWTTGFTLLALLTVGTVFNACSIVIWHNPQGIMVCRLYKCLFATSLGALTLSILWFILAFVIARPSKSTLESQPLVAKPYGVDQESMRKNSLSTQEKIDFAKEYADDYDNTRQGPRPLTLAVHNDRRYYDRNNRNDPMTATTPSITPSRVLFSQNDGQESPMPYNNEAVDIRYHGRTM